MVEPVPSTLRSLKDALESKLVEVDPFLEKLNENHSFNAYARRAGYTKPMLDDKGEPIYDTLDQSIIPENELETFSDQSYVQRGLNHIAKDMCRTPEVSLGDQTLSLPERVKKCIFFFNRRIDDIRRCEREGPHISTTELLQVANDCKSLCEAFLAKQQGQQAGGGLGV
jgi:hypothetical protein